MKRFSPLRVRLAGQETRNKNCHHCFKSRSLWEYFSKHGGIVPMNRFYHKLVWTAAQKHQGSLFLIETNMYESHVAISHVPRSWLLPLYWKIIFLYEETAYTILYMCVWREGGGGVSDGLTSNEYKPLSHSYYSMIWSEAQFYNRRNINHYNILHKRFS